MADFDKEHPFSPEKIAQARGEGFTDEEILQYMRQWYPQHKTAITDAIRRVEADAKDDRLGDEQKITFGSIVDHLAETPVADFSHRKGPDANFTEKHSAAVGRGVGTTAAGMAGLPADMINLLGREIETGALGSDLLRLAEFANQVNPMMGPQAIMNRRNQLNAVDAGVQELIEQGVPEEEARQQVEQAFAERYDIPGVTDRDRKRRISTDVPPAGSEYFKQALEDPSLLPSLGDPMSALTGYQEARERAVNREDLDRSYYSREDLPPDERISAVGGETASAILPAIVAPWMAGRNVAAEGTVGLARKGPFGGMFNPMVDLAAEKPGQFLALEGAGMAGATQMGMLAEGLDPGNPTTRFAAEMAGGMASPLAIAGRVLRGSAELASDALLTTTPQGVRAIASKRLHQTARELGYEPEELGRVVLEAEARGVNVPSQTIAEASSDDLAELVRARLDPEIKRQFSRIQAKVNNMYDDPYRNLNAEDYGTLVEIAGKTGIDDLAVGKENIAEAMQEISSALSPSLAENLPVGTLTGNPALVSMQSALARKSPELASVAEIGQREGMDRLRRASDVLLRSGDPDDLVTGVKLRDEYVDTVISTYMDDVKSELDGVVSRAIATPEEAEAATQDAHKALNRALDEVREIEDAAYKGWKYPTQPNNLKRVMAEINADKLPEDRLPKVVEDTIERIIETNGSDTQELQNLRSMLLRMHRTANASTSSSETSREATRLLMDVPRLERAIMQDIKTGFNRRTQAVRARRKPIRGSRVYLLDQDGKVAFDEPVVIQNIQQENGKKLAMFEAGEGMLEEAGLEQRLRAWPLERVRRVDAPKAGEITAQEQELQLYESALKLTARIEDAFGKSFVGDALGRRASGAEVTAPEVLLNKAMSGSPSQRALRFDQLRRAARMGSRDIRGRILNDQFYETLGVEGSPNEGMQSAIEEYVKFMARKSVDAKTGEVNVPKLQTFLKEEHALFKSKYPEYQKPLDNLRREFLDAIEGQLNYDVSRDAAVALRKREIDNSAFGKVVGDQQTSKVVGNILSKRGGDEAYGDLAAIAVRSDRGDYQRGTAKIRDASGTEVAERRANLLPGEELPVQPEMAPGMGDRLNGPAISGMRAATFKYAADKAGGSTGEFNMAKFSEVLNSPVRPGGPSLLDVMQANGVIDRSMRRRVETITKLSENIQQSAIKGKVLDEGLEDMGYGLAFMALRLRGAKLASRIFGGDSGTSLLAASYGSQQVKKLFATMPGGKIQQMMIDAVQDPELFRMIMMKPSDVGEGRQLFRDLNAWMYGSGYLTFKEYADNLEQVNFEEERG